MKRKWPLELAQLVAEELVALMNGSCDRIQIVGSVRRKKKEVGDVEVLYIPKWKKKEFATDLFGEELTNEATEKVLSLEADGILARRKTEKKGSIIFGEWNKLMVHPATGVPVDLFSTTEECWWNSLVCRTGGAKTNTMISMAAIKRGLKWNNNGPGFTSADSIIPTYSEEDVFKIVGMQYWPPERRF